MTIAAPQPPGPPPAAGTDQLASRRTGLIWGSLALGLVLMLTVVWAVGGFEYRGDRITKVAPGSTVEVGPYELTFTFATVQRVSSSNKWEVLVVGTGRTTKDKTIAPDTGERGIVYSKNPANGEIQTVKSFHYGDSEDIILSQDSFTPGLDPIPFTATFDYAQPVAGELILALFDQEFADNHIFGDDDPTWNRLDTGYSMTLPVKTLPDRKY